MEHLRTTLDRALPDTLVHLVGHSVGGVIAAAFAHRFPERTASFINVEDNFTLADAFWLAQIAPKTPAEVERLMQTTEPSRSAGCATAASSRAGIASAPLRRPSPTSPRPQSRQWPVLSSTTPHGRI
jgi:lipase